MYGVKPFAVAVSPSEYLLEAEVVVLDWLFEFAGFTDTEAEANERAQLSYSPSEYLYVPSRFRFLRLRRLRKTNAFRSSKSVCGH
jgi:hypothetical protein